MKMITTAVAVALAAVLMTACSKKESEAPAEAPPAAAAPAPAAPAAEAPAATSEAPANSEDASQTGGDKVTPKAPDNPPPQG